MDAAHHHKMNGQIRAFFDELAGRWEDCVCPEHAGRLAGIVARLGISSGARVLDVGSGTGVLLPMLAPSSRHEGFVAAIDLSFQMLRQAAQRSGINTARIAMLQADAMRLPFRETAFDWAICNSVFPHFLDQAAAVRELARTLAPGGRLVVCHSQSREAINSFHHSRGGLIGGHTLPDADGMRGIMAAAGLTVTVFEDTAGHYLCVASKD